MNSQKVRLENKPCPMGCSAGDEILLVGYDRLHGLPGEYTVVRCRKCGLMRTNPRPTLDTMRAYYPDNYGPYQGTTVNVKNRRIRFALKCRRLTRRIFELNTDRLPPLSPTRLLEIGCASGAFLHEMAQEGWDVAGIEFSQHAANNARKLGFPVHVGPLETAPPPPHLFDLVVGWMVLEHLSEPLSALQKLYEWTRPGGWLVISVPNAGSLEFRVFKDAWYALQLPTHLYHFTQLTLSNMLALGGWKMVKILHHRILSNLFFSIGYFLSDKGCNDKLIKSLINFLIKTKGASLFFYPLGYLLGLLGQTGRMTVWARKNNSNMH